MAKKISKDEFLSRFNFRYPQAEVEVLEYTSISKPATIRCLKCGRILNRKKARDFLKSFDCDCAGKDSILQLYNNSEFAVVKIIGKKVILRHFMCGCESHRLTNECFDNPFYCASCDDKNSLKNVFKTQLQSVFGDKIILLEFQGESKKNYYKCTQCGKIFKSTQSSILKSTGCPLCRLKGKTA